MYKTHTTREINPTNRKTIQNMIIIYHLCLRQSFKWGYSKYLRDLVGILNAILTILNARTYCINHWLVTLCN